MLAGSPSAAAAPPANDDFAGAVIVDSLPFAASVDSTEATTEPGEPSCIGPPDTNTVWYQITPAASGVLRATVSGAFFAPLISAFRVDGPGVGGLYFQACRFYGPVDLDVEQGMTYALKVGGLFGGGGAFDLRLEIVPTPVNDDFADATQITALPFSEVVELRAATTETAEPLYPGGTPVGGSAWYVFTPAETGLYTVRLRGCCEAVPIVGIYTGNALESLTEIASAAGFFDPKVTFRATAGTPYRIQLARGLLSGGAGSIPVSIELDVTPSPVANFGLSIGDPSIFDDIQFLDFSYDPADVGIQSHEWELGDGTSFSGCCPTHRYTTDGDYQVRLTVATSDGRTATTEQTVQVRTHDVSIARFTTPDRAQVGQTRPIRVEIANHRHPETVQVQLFRNRGGGFELVGTLTQDVPVRPGNRTTSFGFNYTFTTADLDVAFRAAATLLTARDAQPGDNEATSQRRMVTAAIASSPGDPWTDALGGSGDAVLTFGHIGCFDVDSSGFCTGGVWGTVPGAHWIWKTQLVSPDEAANGTAVVTLRKEFRWKGPAGRSATLAISADDHYRVFLNGELAAEGTLNLFSYDTHAVAPKVGVNELEIEVQSFPGPSDPFSSPAGLAYAITPS
jgi:PKD repeat protein